MQELVIGIEVLIVLLEVLIAFLCVIGVGLIRFSKGVMYKLWSAAWILFTISSTVVILSTSIEGLSLIDAVSAGGILLSALLLLDGTHERRRYRSREVLLYPIVFTIGFSFVPIGIIVNLTYGVVFTPGACLIAYACFSSAIQLRKKSLLKDFDYYTLSIGLITWGATMIFFPLNIFVDALAFQLIFTTTGLIMTGAGLLNVFIRETTENLKVQNSIAQLISSIVNHDIRNYVATLAESIHQMQTSSDDRQFWLDLSSEAVESMTDFVEEIRNISAGMTRLEAQRELINIYDLLNDVKQRVTREYNLTEDAITITFSEDMTVLTNSIVRELFWNIIDNAFKHGCQHLLVQAQKGDDFITLEICDDSGGLQDDVFKFLNDPNSLSSKDAPGKGLGVILIKGLSFLCGIRFKVSNKYADDEIVGTIFSLQFDKHVSA